MNKCVAIVILGDFNYDARVINMAHSLLNSGYQVDIFHASNANQKKNDNLKVKNIQVNVIGILKYINWNIKLYWLLKKSKYQTIICSDLYSLPATCFALNKSCIIYDSREIFSELAIHLNSPIKKYFLKFVEKKCMQYVNKVLTTAPTDEKYLKKLYHEYKHIDYAIIYNYAHRYSKSPFYLRKKLHLRKKNKIFLYQGVIQKGRGIELMFSLVQHINNAVAVIVGDGEHKEYYKKKYAGRENGGRVFFIDRVPYKYLLSLTNEADVGCLLIEPLGISNKFALPNKLFEYALCGVPSLASALSNLDLYINKYNLGKIINASSISDLVSGANFLLTQTRLKNHLKKNATKFFSWKTQENHFVRFVSNDK